MIVAFGDSYVEPGSPIVAELSAALASPVRAGGWRGARVRTWLSDPDRARATVLGADVVLVHLGGNAPTHDPSEVAELDRIIRGAARPGARVVWTMTDVPAGSPIYGRGADMRSAVKRAGAELLGVVPTLDASGLAPDLVHPNRAGARSWAAQVAPALRSLRSASKAGSVRTVRFAAVGVVLGVGLLWWQLRGAS